MIGNCVPQKKRQTSANLCVRDPLAFLQIIGSFLTKVKTFGLFLKRIRATLGGGTQVEKYAKLPRNRYGGLPEATKGVTTVATPTPKMTTEGGPISPGHNLRHGSDQSQEGYPEKLWGAKGFQLGR